MNKTSNQTVTLEYAIFLQVEEFAKSGQKFSAHDVTTSIRNKCNAGKLEIPEVEDLSGVDTHRYKVEHKAVNSLFKDMQRNGTVSVQKQYNGMYFDYTATLNVPVPSKPSPTVQTPSTPTISVNRSEICDRVNKYLVNCENRNFYPSIKHVQSAIKRGSRSTGTSATDLIDMINTLGYNINRTGNINTSYVQF
jgi:hypothetical protein